MSTPERPSAEARDRFLAAASRQTPSRPGAWGRRLMLAGLASVAWWGAMLALLGIRPDWGDLPASSLSATLLGLLAAAALASAMGLARGRSMVGSPSEALSVAALGIPLALFLLVVALDPQGASTVATTTAPSGHVLRAWPCGLLVVLVALPLVGVGLLVLRGLVLSRPTLVGACLGLAAATWAHLLIRVHCPIGGPGHAVLGHLLPLLPLMALGAWLVRGRRGK
jgi:hypothetical protein